MQIMLSVLLTLWPVYFLYLQRNILNRKKSYDQPDSIFKSRDINLPTKVRLVKAMVSPVVMHGCGVGLYKRFSTEELMLLNRGVGEDS